MLFFRYIIALINLTKSFDITVRHFFIFMFLLLERLLLTMAAPSKDKDLDAHIPSALHGPTLLMSATPISTGNYPTIFVGIVDGLKYTNEMWEQHKNLLAVLFCITDPAVIGELKIGSVSRHLVDGRGLQEQFTITIEFARKN